MGIKEMKNELALLVSNLINKQCSVFVVDAFNGIIEFISTQTMIIYKQKRGKAWKLVYDRYEYQQNYLVPNLFLI